MKVKVCGQVSIPEVDNTLSECVEFHKSICIVVSHLSNKVKNMEGENLNEYLQRLDDKLSNMDNIILNLKTRIENLEANA